MAKQKRIICYAINGAGLGHVTRLLAVAKWLRRYGALLDEKPPEILFLTSSDASDILAQAGFAAFKIPSKTVARKTELNKLEYRRLAKHFVWNMLGVFSPDLLVVDTFPSGSFDELFQVLDGPFRKSFIYRKVKPDYAARPTFRSAIRMYDSVVAPHTQSESDGFLDPGKFDSNKRIQFTGEVIQFERDDMLAPKLAREQLGVPLDRRLVYISAGGGGDPNAETQLRRLVETIGQVDGVHLLVGAGPLYRGRRLAGPNITWHDGPAIGKYFSAVDAAVCAAGYNTFHELLFAGVPTAFFAQEKIADDQAERIEAAFNVGACLKISDWEDANATIETLNQLLSQTVATNIRSACEEYLPSNGARQCAIELLKPLYDSQRLQWCQQVLSPRLASRLEAIGGTTSSISQWMIPLVPQDQIRSLKTNPLLNRVMGQLSQSATQELQQALADNEAGFDQSTFESQLIDLFDSIQQLPADRTSHAADEALKTILAVMKKQPRGASTANSLAAGNSIALDSEDSYGRWICDIVHGVNRLLNLIDLADANGDSQSIDHLEAIRLYRVFPRIVDAEASESLDLFESFFAKKKQAGVPQHEISKAIQLIKLTHPRVTKSILESSMHATVATGGNEG